MTRRYDSSEKAGPPKDWYELARKLHGELERTPFGGREEKLRDLAGRKENQAASNTIRRSLAAYAKLTPLAKSTGLAQSQLAALPLATIEAIARWAEYDVPNAKGAARAAVRGDLRTRAVVQAERDAREEAGVRNWGKSRKAAARKYIESFLERKFPRREDLPRWQDENDALDFQFIGGNHRVAVLIFGPYQHVTKPLISEFVQRLLGVALIHDFTIAGVPEKNIDQVKETLERYTHFARVPIEEIAKTLFVALPEPSPRKR